jgi:hypothetical protein
MKILILSLCDLEKDPRISKQINCLQKNHSVTCVGKNPPLNQNVEFLRVNYQFPLISFIIFSFFSILKKYDLAYEQFFKSKMLKSLKLPEEKKFDLIIANDIDTLPFSFTIKRDAKILFDAHEYSPKELDDNFFWRVLFQGYRFYLCRKYLPRCDAMMTVCEGISEEYQKEFGVLPYVITNASEFYDFTPSYVDPNNIKIIHHGVADPDRKIENMIELMRFVDSRFSLDLMLVPLSQKYLKKLKRLARNLSVNFIDPVPMKEIVKTTNNYDIGLHIIEPKNFNDRHALPNKFFEFIQARLAIAIGPSPEMARIVNKYDLGVISTDFKPETLAKSLNQLTAEKIQYFKMRSHQTAFELSSVKNTELLEDIINNHINYDVGSVPK